MRALLPMWLLACCWLLGCTAESHGSELAIHVASDLRVPDELDRVTINVVGQAVDEDPAADLRKAPLPRTLRLVHEAGPLGPLEITVRGFRGSELVVQRDLQAWFVESSRSELTVELQRACVAMFCEAGQTCEQGRCVPVSMVEDAGVRPDGGRDGGDMDAAPRDGDAPRDAARVDAADDDSAADDAAAAETDAHVEASVPVDAASDAARVDAGDAGDGAPPDATMPPPGAGAPPVCSLTLPAVGDSYTVQSLVALRGSCLDPETGPLSSGLRWTSSQDGLLGTTASLDAPLRSPGAHRLSLCAQDPRDATVLGCASVDTSVTVGPQPSVLISGLSQAGTSAPPFRAGAAIVFTGVGSGAGVTLRWTDDLQGVLGDGSTASLSAPLVGRHVVTLTVRDRTGAELRATRSYTVVASGESNLLSPYVGVNDTLEDVGDPEVSMIASDPLSRVYVPSSAGPLYRFASATLGSPGTVAIGQPPLRAVVRDAQIVADKGLTYLATADGLTVCSYTAQGGVVEPCSSYTRSLFGLPTSDVRSVLRLVDSQGNDTLLVGTSSGLFFAENVSGSSRGTSILRSRVINDMVAVGGRAALATDSGLYLLDVATQTTARFTTVDGLVNNQVRSLAVASDGSLWVGTAGGLSHFEPGAARWTQYTAANGLGDNRVHGVAVQRVTELTPARDVVWVATSGGVVRLDTASNTLSRFTTVDGLPSNEVLAVHVLASGSKLFGTVRGIARYVGP